MSSNSAETDKSLESIKQGKNLLLKCLQGEVKDTDEVNRAAYTVNYKVNVLISYMQSFVLLRKFEDKLRSLMELNDHESSTGELRERNLLLERAYKLVLTGSEIDKAKPPTQMVEKVNKYT